MLVLIYIWYHFKVIGRSGEAQLRVGKNCNDKVGILRVKTVYAWYVTHQ